LTPEQRASKTEMSSLAYEMEAILKLKATRFGLGAMSTHE
jgi:hypothetical protein